MVLSVNGWYKPDVFKNYAKYHYICCNCNVHKLDLLLKCIQKKFPLLPHKVNDKKKLS